MLEIGTALDVGIRRQGKENQDALLVVGSTANSQGPPLLVVADGMGGYHGGEIASRAVVEAMKNHFLKSNNSDDLLEVLNEGVQEAHLDIKNKALGNPSLLQMGSTVVAAVIADDILHVVNVGDSRAYLISEDRIEQVNQDHSLLAEEIRKNNLTPEQIRDFPRKNVLTMSLSAQRVDVDPFTLKRRIEPDEHLLLCSDGLWGVVPEEQIKAVVMQLPAQRAANKLVYLANANKGPDNIAIIIARRSHRYSSSVNEKTIRLPSA